MAYHDIAFVFDTVPQRLLRSSMVTPKYPMDHQFTSIQGEFLHLSPVEHGAQGSPPPCF